MTFEGDALILGAGVVLAKVGGASDDARLAALLSAAHNRPITPRALAHIRRAAVKKREGETTLALIHIALSGAAKLERPAEGARRLFVADELMKAGIAPGAVSDVFCRFDGALDDLERRYDPDQPRVPAGNGRASGQWTSGDWADTDAAATSGSATSTDKPVDHPSESQHRIRIADNSDSWAQYLNPIGEAEAAENRSGRPFNGGGPNLQHSLGIEEAKAAYEANNCDIVAGETYVYIPGAGVRRYDFVARDRTTGDLIGVEVKTTQLDAISLNKTQVEKDIALLKAGGVPVPSLGGRKITMVAYEAFCGGCWSINVQKAYLFLRLKEEGIPMKFGPFPVPHL